MDHRNSQVGWTEAQWNRVREEVLQAWQRVRVAGSFLPIYGPLPPSTQVVPSEVLECNGSVDDRATADLVEIDLPVVLSRQQVLEEDLSSALLQFRRRAAQLGQLEDWFIFNGTYPSIRPKDSAKNAFEAQGKAGHSDYRPSLDHLDGLCVRGTPRPIDGVNQNLQLADMRRRNPGSLGLIEGPRVQRDEQLEKEAVPADEKAQDAQREAEAARDKAKEKQSNQQTGQTEEAEAAKKEADKAEEKAKAAKEEAWQAWDKAPLDSNGLMHAIVEAINSLEYNGYVAPYVCVFGRKPYQAAFESIPNSTVLPRDRIEPLIGRELLHASGIDIVPRSFDLFKSDERQWRSRGVLLSMANEPIDLALAAEATPEFRQVNAEGRYVFSVFERFALRIKDAKAIAPLRFR